MRILIIPDVHEQIYKLQPILDKELSNVDEVVFLGDWFDDFDTTVFRTEATIKFLNENSKNQKYTFLYGNHDLPYAFPNVGALSCSGHNWFTAKAINENREIFDNFRFAHRVDNYLFTHAGLHPGLLEDLKCTLDDLSELCKDVEKSFALGTGHPLVYAGRSRGGFQRLGGLTWLDWSEFKPIEGVTQIVGHTRGREVRFKGDNVCLDTHLNNYAILDTETKKLEVFKTCEN